MKGLELNELFYREVVNGILQSNFPNLKYSAALIGWGSDVLGFDDAQSTDHNWGLRFQLFLSDEDFKRFSNRINQILAGNLPREFHGFPVDFDVHVNSDQRGERETYGHNIEVESIERFFKRYLGVNPFHKITTADWLTFPEHKLLAVTSGKIFDDRLAGRLESVRQKFGYYPQDVWLYLLAAQWQKIFEEQAFIGRAGQAGDDLGSRLIAAQQVEKLMRLCFLIERKYAPYNKWFGSAFSRLACADYIKPIFEEVFHAKDWRMREEFLAQAYRAIIRIFNDLKVTNPMSEEVSGYFNRPFLVIKDESVVQKLRAAITDEEVKKLKYCLGSVNQFFDSTAQLNEPALIEQLKLLYQ